MDLCVFNHGSIYMHLKNSHITPIKGTFQKQLVDKT